MALTAQLGTANSKPINLEPGLNAIIAAQATATPASLVVEVAFANDPIQNAGYYYANLNDGPIGYWRMDNQTSLVDQTGSGNTMTIEGTPTLTTGLVTGDSNQATIFNGTTQDGYVTSSSAFSPTTAFSFERWIKTPGSLPGSTADLDAKRGSYRLQLTSTGNLVFSVKNATLTASITSTTALATSTSYHVATVYDGAKLNLYLNGVLNASTSYSGGVEATQSRLKVGGADNSSASPGYRSNTFTSDVSAGGTANKPAGTVDGDYMLTQIHFANFFQAPPTITNVPAGWTLLTSRVGGSSAMYVYGKLASSEPASWNWNWSANSTWKVTVSSYTGVSSVVPVGSCNTTASSSTTTIAASSLPAYDNTMVVSLYGVEGSGVITMTESLGTERLEYALNSSTVVINTLAVGTAALQTNTGTASTSCTELLAATIELVGTLSSTYASITYDEASFFGYALSAAQVSNHYYQAVNPPPTITWTDITADVKGVQITRGRQYELNRIEAGTASLTLNDDLRKYDPANTGSPYSPNVIPMRQIRIRANFNSTLYPLFCGYIERWESHWESGWGNHAECDITAVDGFEPLSLTAEAGTTQSTLAGTTIANLLGTASWSNTARVLDAGAFTTAAINRSASTSILEYIQQVADGENGLFFIDASGNAVFHDKNHRSTNTRSTTSQGTFGDQTLIALPYTALAPSKDKDHIVNDWTVNDATGTANQAQDMTSQTRYFHRTASRSTFLTPGDASTMASYLLSVTASPGYRFNVLELCPNRNQPLWLQALQREISDRVTVQRQPVGVTPGSQIVQDCWIEAIKWTINPSAPWRVQWQLSPAT